MPHRDPETARKYFADRYQAKKAEVEAKKKEYRAAIGEDEHLRRRREYNRRSKYGLTPEAFDALFEKQSGLCPICTNALDLAAKKGPATVCVDHSHTTGEVRGLLCRGCNVAVCFIEKRPERTAAVLAYLNPS